ncbi:hypothetical protein JANAI62_35730 [Jannaschia pagri]|uniref:Uncharacterized protein n=2 Tax=Roseobacteraceae TaxID=2854170 RepID=A0ABQ4NR99_9RHOB|nr:hypothetical protein JANAI61_36010 [Jannaschia sp. AI_61]GIT96950.1 hypothetical protein JANAI62_35730 [Jannaschia sp. AI_62]
MDINQANGPEDQIQLSDSWRDDDGTLSEAAYRTIVIASEYAAQAKKQNADSAPQKLWHEIRTYADAEVLGYTASRLERSISRVGILHNNLNENGVPLPQRYVQNTAPLPSGWHGLDFVEVKDGAFFVVGETAEHVPPLLIAEDLDVALYLTYLAHSSPIAPTFSLEGTGADVVHLNLKVFDPPWLAATNFGQSMFFADWLMKGLTMGSVPSVLEPHKSSAMDNSWQQPPLFDELARKVGVQQAGLQNRGAIVAMETPLDVAQNGDVIQLRPHPSVWIDSSMYRDLADGTREHFRRNDPETLAGMQAQTFHQNYYEVSRMYPVFERVRLLAGLMAAVNYAHHAGVKLSASEQARLKRTIGPLKRTVAQEELVSRPFHEGGCFCTGGVEIQATAKVKSTQKTLFTKGVGGSGGESTRTIFDDEKGAPSVKKDFNWESIRPEWTTWAHYPQETVDGKVYAKLAGRYYTHHAVQGMNLPAFGFYAGDPAVANENYVGVKKNIETGHSISPRFVENCIRNGSSELQPNNRYKFKDGNVRVITDFSKKFVISVGYGK